MKTLILLKLMLLTFVPGSPGQAADNWRGPDRQGIFHESGLLQDWHEGAPELLWSYGRLGEGFSSPVIANGKIYITGMEGSTGYVYILSMNGSLEKKFPYGPEFTESYQGTRSTPTVVKNLVYIVSGQGLLVCIDQENGEIVWRRDMFGDFGGRNIRWGVTENLLIEEDILYCSPGGEKYNIVALNRHSGEVIWTTRGAGGVSAYCSPLLVDHYGRKMLITHMAYHIVGIDARSGRLMWSFSHVNRHEIHPNTPIYHEGSVFAFSGNGKGGVKLKLSSVGDAATIEWTNSDLDNLMGGAVLVDGYIYGSGHRNRSWFMVDWETGETVYSSRNIANGTVVYADRRLYCYSERGELVLLEPAKGGFIERGRKNITLGSNQHWAHLVINNGILYLRRGNALMAYKVN
jgi:outer membrane protein assembly factor BamB